MRYGALPPGLIARALRSAMFNLAGSRDYVGRRGAEKMPDDLRKHDLIAVGDLLDYAAAAGIGIAPVLAMLFEDPALRDTLIPVLRNHPFPQAVRYAVYASRKFTPPKLRTFVESVAQYLSRLPNERSHTFRRSIQRRERRRISPGVLLRPREARPGTFAHCTSGTAR